MCVCPSRSPPRGGHLEWKFIHPKESRAVARTHTHTRWGALALYMSTGNWRMNVIKKRSKKEEEEEVEEITRSKREEEEGEIRNLVIFFLWRRRKERIFSDWSAT